MAERVRDTERPRDRVVERVRDRVAERVRDTKQLRQSGRESERHRAAKRERERDRKKEGCAGSVRGRIRISKIIILPLKNVEINPKKKACYVSARYPFTGLYGRILPVRGRYSRYFRRYETKGYSVLVRYILTVPTGTVWNSLP